MSEVDDEVLIRAMQPGDAPWIVRSWIQSYETDGREEWRGMGAHPEVRAIAHFLDPKPPASSEWQWRPVYAFLVLETARVNWLLREGEVRVAAWREDPTQIAGWVCWTRRALQYVHVKHHFRRRGIATRLLAEVTSPPRYAYVTAAVKPFVPKEWTYDRWEKRP